LILILDVDYDKWKPFESVGIGRKLTHREATEILWKEIKKLKEKRK